MSLLEARRKLIARLTLPPVVHRGLPQPLLVLNNLPFYDDDDLQCDSSTTVSKSLPPAETDFSTNLHDPLLLQIPSKYLSPEGLKLEGGDITHDLYKLKQPRALRRSFLSLLVIEQQRKGSRAGLFNVPGGFRRQYLLQKHHANKTPNFVTRNFVEFLSIYGHFAGEDLEDDDAIICHYRAGHIPDEEQALLGDHNGRVRGTASDRKVFFLLLKAFVGTGVLFLPKAFSNGGMMFSIVTLAFFGALSYWCYLILIFTKEKVAVLLFAEIGQKLYGRSFQRLILLSIVVSQLGFVAAYIVFTAENMKAFLANTLGINVLKPMIIAAQAVLLTPLSLIRDITKLLLLAVIANLCVMWGLVTIVYYVLHQLIVVQDFHPGPGVEWWFNEEKFSLFIGVAIFAFEGIGLIIPIQELMIHPHHFPKVLAQVIFTILAIMIFMGTIGYVTYGKNIHTVILLNLPQSSPVVSTIQLFYLIAILLLTPLQLFPAIRLIELKLITGLGKALLAAKWKKNIFRTVSVLVVLLVAVFGGQNLDKFVLFVGCFACIPLVYMYPALLHYKSCCDVNEPGITDEQRKKRWWLGVFDWFLLVIGLVALVYTTYDILK